MTKCDYCGTEYEIPRGLTFIKTDGKVIHLCSSKCRKNLDMKRRNVKWIKNAAKNEVKK